MMTTKYLRADITIETEIIGSKKFYIYNYQGIHYRVFSSLMGLQNFFETGDDKMVVFECTEESELDEYLYGSDL